MQPLDQRARWVERQKEWQSLKLSHPILTPGKGSSCCQGWAHTGKLFQAHICGFKGGEPPSFLSGSKSPVGFRDKPGRKKQECCAGMLWPLWWSRDIPESRDQDLAQTMSPNQCGTCLSCQRGNNSLLLGLSFQANTSRDNSYPVPHEQPIKAVTVST